MCFNSYIWIGKTYYSNIEQETSMAINVHEVGYVLDSQKKTYEALSLRI